MRKEFYSELQNLIAEDSRVVALLGDIGVFSFIKNLFHIFDGKKESFINDSGFVKLS